MFFIDFDPFLFFLMGFDCFEHDGGRCGWGTVWMGTALNKFDLIGCVFYWAGTAPGGTAWGTAFPNIRTVWSEVSREPRARLKGGHLWGLTQSATPYTGSQGDLLR